MKKSISFPVLLVVCILLCGALFGCSTKQAEPICSVQTSSWNTTDNYNISFNGEKFVTDHEYVVCLEKNPEKDFVILNLTDVQLGDGEIDFNAEFVRRADKTIDELVKKIQPDLITVTGDQGYGTKKSIECVGGLIDRYGIPWAPVFGNHDNQEDVLTTHQQAYLYENGFKNCIFKSGPNNLATVESGNVAYGNYIVNVVERDSSPKRFHVVKSLLFINSRDNMDYSAPEYKDQKRVNGSSYAMLSHNQIEWYKWAVSKVQPYGAGGKVTSAIFLHIPIYAYNLAFDAAFKTDADLYDYNAYDSAVKNDDAVKAYTDKSIWNEGYEDSVGGRRECICSAPYDDHVFDAILDYDDNAATDFVSTDLIVAGHDHVNNFIIEYQGVTMAYGLKTGSGCYYDEDLSGGSVILVRGDGSDVIYHQFTDIHVALFPWWIYLLIAVGCLAVVTTVVLLLIKFKVIPIKKK